MELPHVISPSFAIQNTWKILNDEDILGSQLVGRHGNDDVA